MRARGWSLWGSAKLAAVVAAVTLTGACGSITAAEGEVSDAGRPPGIRVDALGGIAALHAIAEIDSATAIGSWSMGPLCDDGRSCMPRDTLVGSVPRTMIEAFFIRTYQPEFRSLRADYGASTQGADMRGYIVTIRANGRTRTLRADDGTMPSLMAHFVNDVNAAVIEAIR